MLNVKVSPSNINRVRDAVRQPSVSYVIIAHGPGDGAYRIAHLVRHGEGGIREARKWAYADLKARSDEYTTLSILAADTARYHLAQATACRAPLRHILESRDLVGERVRVTRNNTRS